MNMIFVGDVAVPPGFTLTEPNGSDVFSDILIANLEGPIVSNAHEALRRRRLFNDPTVGFYLQSLNARVVSLANNHIMDMGAHSLESTITVLQRAGIMTCGAGRNWNEAAAPAVLQDSGRRRVFLAFGWEPIKCKAATQTRPGVNPLRPSHLLESVQWARASYPGATLILLMHWNYELEAYPQPMHRALAFAAIDAGAHAVIGHHSHCVQGIEVYKGAPIVYGLGNWLMPHGYYFGGSLRYPEFTRRQLAFQWQPETGEMFCHWFEYDPANHQIRWVRSSHLDEDPDIRSYTPFRGMEHVDYIHWFRYHRRKRLLLPLYTHYDHSFTNQMKDKWVHLRGRIIDVLVSFKIKQGPR